MRNPFLWLAAIASIAAIIIRFLNFPILAAIALVMLAGILLVLALKRHRELMLPAEPHTLNSEERATIVRMKREGRYGFALEQVCLWKRGISTQEAQRLVDEAS